MIELAKKAYIVKVPKETPDGVENFLRWAATHHYENCKEVPATYETIGDFVLKEAYKKQVKFTPALFFEDENGNIIEYFVAKNKNILTHDFFLKSRNPNTTPRKEKRL